MDSPDGLRRQYIDGSRSLQGEQNESVRSPARDYSEALLCRRTVSHRDTGIDGICVYRVRRPADLRTLLSSRLVRRAAVDSIVRRISARAQGPWSTPMNPATSYSITQAHYRDFIEETAERFDHRRLLDGAPAPSDLAGHAAWISTCAEMALGHRFDLGFERWIELAEEAAPPGFLGTRYSGNVTDRIRRRIEPESPNEEGRIPPVLLRHLYHPEYESIPWNMDPLTGFRWDTSLVHAVTTPAGAPGADVRLAWEVARLQHLPLLAMAHATSPEDLQKRLVGEFVDQVVDFNISNPPGFGIHWTSGMEVGIRMANIALALSMFAASGAEIERPDLEVIVGSVVDHMRFCLARPDRRPFLTHNHYLVQLCGLVIGAALFEEGASAPGFDPSRILHSSAAELSTQISEQFQDDGSNFEGSTGYHLFASQAAALGLAVARRRAPRSEGLDEATARLASAGRFLDAVTDDSGRIPMIGDFDGGRFVVIERRPRGDNSPAWDRLFAPPVIGAVAAASGFLPEYHEEALESLDASLVRLIVPGETFLPVRGRLGSMPHDDMADWPLVRIIARGWDGAAPASRRLWVFSEAQEPAFFGAGTTFELPPIRSADLIELFAECKESPTFHPFPRFGLYVYRGDGLFATIRCGPPGQRGWAGHSHADQLSMTLALGGRTMLSDAGSFVYGASPEIRRAYRSARAHNGPYASGVESLEQTGSLFGAPGAAEGRCLAAFEKAFAGTWRDGGASFWRLVLISREPGIDTRLSELAGPTIPRPAERAKRSGAHPSWSVAVLDWSEGAALAEHALFPCSGAYARLG